MTAAVKGALRDCKIIRDGHVDWKAKKKIQEVLLECLDGKELWNVKMTTSEEQTQAMTRMEYTEVHFSNFKKMNPKPLSVSRRQGLVCWWITRWTAPESREAVEGLDSLLD